MQERKKERNKERKKWNKKWKNRERKIDIWKKTCCYVGLGLEWKWEWARTITLLHFLIKQDDIHKTSSLVVAFYFKVKLNSWNTNA